MSKNQNVQPFFFISRKMTEELREMEQISNEEWQIEKTMTSGSLLCSVTFFIFSVVRQLIVAVSRVVENDYVSTGLNFNENIQLINLARSLSFIFAALNMPIVFLLFIVQNLEFREQLKKEFCSLRVFCQKPHQKTTENDTSKASASAVQQKGNT